MRILVLNCGSSSIKYRLFDEEQSVAKGIVERIGQDDSDVAGHRDGLQRVMNDLDADMSGGGLEAIGHRVVHGGDRFAAPMRIDDEVEAAIDELARCQQVLARRLVVTLEIGRRRLGEHQDAAG